MNHAVDVVDRAGGTQRFVLRRWARPGWELDDPDYSAEREALILGVLEATEVPAPRVIAADPDAAECDVPALLLTRLPGEPPTARSDDAFLSSLAETLVLIHGVDVAGAAPLYRRYHNALSVPRWFPESETWDRCFDVASRTLEASGSCFIHRDFHPGNTLWMGDRLSGVVDWTQASWGSPAVDVGHMRVNLAADVGVAAAERFLELHTAIAGELADQPYWDLVTIVDVVADARELFPAPAMARLEALASSALDRMEED